MNSLVSYPTRQEVVAALRARYRSANRAEKSRILDEFVALTGAHRKHAIRTLRTDPLEQPSHDRKGRRIYDEAIRQSRLRP